MWVNIKGDEEKKTDKATRIEANLEPLDRDGLLWIIKKKLKNCFNCLNHV